MNSPIVEKSYAFALRIIKMYQHLSEEKREFILSKQVLRAGTSIGANVREATGAQSENDFLSKEAKETEYWLLLLRDSGFLSPKSSESILKDCTELIKMLGSAIATLKRKSPR